MADDDDPTDLIKIGPIDLAEIVTNAERDDLDIRLRVIRDMSETAANAAKEMARFRHAVPAEEKTKQEQERTKRSQELTRRVQSDGVTRMGFGGMLAAISCLTLYMHPITLGGVLVAIAGIFGGKDLAKTIIKAIKGDHKDD